MDGDLRERQRTIVGAGRNGGGGPSVARHLSAYLFEKATHFVSTFARVIDASMDDGTRYPKVTSHVPVYTVTSRWTLSAAESFTFGLRVNHRVTIVGERTRGRAHFGNIVQFAAGFYMFVPAALPAIQKRTWVGKRKESKPDVEVKYDEALQTAIGLIGSVTDASLTPRRYLRRQRVSGPVAERRAGHSRKPKA